MNISAILPFVQIILSLLLIGAILLQQSDAGLGSAFGSDSGSSVKTTRRGFDKWIFNATIVIAILFAASAVIALVIR